MCTLYSIRSTQAEMRRAFEIANDRDELGNYEPRYAVFPDQPAPVVTSCDDGRVLTRMRWGIPGPKQFGEHPVTNVRNVKSPHWRPWLKPAYRCLVPVTSFSEYADTKPRKTPVWFALSDERPRGGRAPAVLVPHLRAERRRRLGPSEGHAGAAHDTGRVADLARSADRGGDGAAAAPAER